ncbi:MAG: hypothetical protein ABGZ17_31700 [Planctomycetaceae bacterium]
MANDHRFAATGLLVNSAARIQPMVMVNKKTARSNHRVISDAESLKHVEVTSTTNEHMIANPHLRVF